MDLSALSWISKYSDSDSEQGSGFNFNIHPEIHQDVLVSLQLGGGPSFIRSITLYILLIFQ